MFKKFIKTAENLWYILSKYIALPSFSNSSSQYSYFQIKPFKYSEHTIGEWIGFLTNFSNIKKNISFFIKWNSANIKLFVKIPTNIEKYFENAFYASFPTSELIKVESNNFKNIYKYEWYIHFETSANEKLKLLTIEDFSPQWNYLWPFKDILSIFYNVPANNELKLDYEVIFDTQHNIFIKLLNFLFLNFLKLIGLYKPTESEEDKKDLKFFIRYQLKNNYQIKKLIEKNLISVYDKFTHNWEVNIWKKIKRIFANFKHFANFYCLPNKQYTIKNLEYITYRKLPFPSNLPTLQNTDKNEITLLGYTDYKNEHIKFGIKEEDKLRHIYIIGKTWMWKSTLISNMVRSDMISNKWVWVIDPHGDLIDTILQYIPSRRINDVILFDVSDFQRPIWFNILEYSSEEEKNIIVSWIVSTFKKLYGNSWGPRLEYILRNTLLSIIEYPNATLMHLTRMLTDKNFKEEVLEYVKDPIVLKFWRNEFDKWNEHFRQEAISPIVNKVGQFLSSPIVRNIFWQPKSKLNIRKIMDEGKILLVNLSKWKIWEDNAAMIWSFLVTKFQIDAMWRADIPFEQRKPFYLYIDEFQNFATESFESILSEARKYKLSLTIANQYISQIEENIRNAIFGNVGTIISFWLWYDDAEIMSKQFKELITPIDLLSLPKFKAYIKLMIDWVTSDPFSMQTFPLPTPPNWPDVKEKVKKQSRQRYAIKKEELEKLIKIWAEKTFSPVEKAIEKAKNMTGSQKIKSEDNQKIHIDTTEKKESSKNLKENLSSDQTLSIDDIKLWQRYKWIVKLKYNYWLFVMLPWGKVEGLLHKKKIKVPEWVRWKDLYNIWDIIEVKAEKFKEVDGEKKVEWTQF